VNLAAKADLPVKRIPEHMGVAHTLACSSTLVRAWIFSTATFVCSITLAVDEKSACIFCIVNSTRVDDLI
jgi:hypothetical protein